MRKRWFIYGTVILLIFPLLLSGCGVSQEEYNVVLAERDAAKTEVQLLQSDLAEAQAQIQSLIKDSVEAQAELQASKERMLQAKTNAEIVNSIFIPAVTGELDEISEIEAMSLVIEGRDKIKTTEDSQMMTKFEALIDSKFGEEQMLDFFVYVLKRIPEILE